ncbi:MAG: hypothetical protein NXI10_15820 [bacterium]|nr:hypothetical protein [bacterium]
MKSILPVGLSAFLLLITLSSCETKSDDYVDEGKIEKENYSNDEIGWTMSIPAGWELETRAAQQSTINKGLNAMEESGGVSIDVSDMKILLNFKKDRFNSFQSTSEAMQDWTLEEWDENNDMVNGLVYETLVGQGIKVDTSTSTTLIDGLQFNVLHTKIYGPNGEVILEQDMCSRLINGNDFGATMCYNNEKDKATLWKVFRNSKFTKREH